MSHFTIKTLTARHYEVIVPRKIQDEVKKRLKNRELINRFYKKTAKTRNRALSLRKTAEKTSF
ncbi:MAG: hypothetical protein C5S48_08600 [Candidatus Methanogaster sp.]|nr:MAG: hypothetical protein C5S48_08600 [ANME-2 cluster archaeon]